MKAGRHAVPALVLMPVTDATVSNLDSASHWKNIAAHSQYQLLSHVNSTAADVFGAGKENIPRSELAPPQTPDSAGVAFIQVMLDATSLRNPPTLHFTCL